MLQLKSQLVKINEISSATPRNSAQLFKCCGLGPWPIFGAKPRTATLRNSPPPFRGGSCAVARLRQGRTRLER